MTGGRYSQGYWNIDINVSYMITRTTGGGTIGQKGRGGDHLEEGKRRRPLGGREEAERVHVGASAEGVQQSNECEREQARQQLCSWARKPALHKLQATHSPLAAQLLSLSPGDDQPPARARAPQRANALLRWRWRWRWR